MNWRWLLAAWAMTIASCQVDDTGKACTPTEVTEIGDEPVGGETPLVEVVRVQRDGACESFKCLRHMGLDPYCTRECTFIETPETPPCNNDADCDEPAKCAQDGVCRADNCADGFACRTIQQTGPEAGRFYCTRRTCDENIDCGNLGVINCVQQACYDSCLNDDTTVSCGIHALTCEPTTSFFSTVECFCANDGVSVEQCPDAQLQCKLPDDFDFWPEASVTRRGVCIAAQPVE